MTPDQVQRWADSLLSTSTDLWDRLETVARKSVIHSNDVLSVAVVVGRLEGIARAIEWHARHEGGKT